MTSTGFRPNMITSDLNCIIFIPDDDEIYGEKATRKFEFQIQVNRILQIFDEMIVKIETLLCIQSFIKDRFLMEKYFSVEDIRSLEKYCNMRIMCDNDELENENVSRLIRLLLNSDLNFHVASHKESVRSFSIFYFMSFRPQ